MGCGFELDAIAGLQLLMDRVGDREGSRAKQACITPNQADCNSDTPNRSSLIFI